MHFNNKCLNLKKYKKLPKIYTPQVFFECYVSKYLYAFMHIKVCIRFLLN